jgi:hypothetical protein
VELIKSIDDIPVAVPLGRHRAQPADVPLAFSGGPSPDLHSAPRFLSPISHSGGLPAALTAFSSTMAFVESAPLLPDDLVVPVFGIADDFPVVSPTVPGGAFAAFPGAPCDEDCSDLFDSLVFSPKPTVQEQDDAAEGEVEAECTNSIVTPHDLSRAARREAARKAAQQKRTDAHLLGVGDLEARASSPSTASTLVRTLGAAARRPGSDSDTSSSPWSSISTHQRKVSIDQASVSSGSSGFNAGVRRRRAPSKHEDEATRKAKNRAAATRSREKRRAEAEFLKVQNAELCSQLDEARSHVSRLEQDNANLKSQVTLLTSLLSKHMAGADSHARAEKRSRSNTPEMAPTLPSDEEEDSSSVSTEEAPPKRLRAPRVGLRSSGVLLIAVIAMVLASLVAMPSLASDSSMPSGEMLVGRSATGRSILTVPSAGPAEGTWDPYVVWRMTNAGAMAAALLLGLTSLCVATDSWLRGE